MPQERQKTRSRTGGGEDDSIGLEEQRRGISPLDPASMPRAEDDDQTYARSPEFHDRVPPEPAPPGEGSTPEGHSPDAAQAVKDDEQK